MSYISQNLPTGDELIYMGHQAIYKFIPAFVGSFALCAVSLVAHDSLRYAILASGFIWFIITSFRFGSVEFGITTRSVIIKKGLFSIQINEMDFGKVESVNVEQSFIGRIFSVGDMQIVGMGSTEENIKDVKYPEKFKKAFYDQKDRYMKNQSRPTSPIPVSLGIPDRV